MFLEKSQAFLRGHAKEKPDQPFFLFHSMQAVHLPSFAAPEFAGKTEAGPHGIRVNAISPGFVAGPRIDWVIKAQAEARGLTEDEVRTEFEGQSPLEKLTQAGDIADMCVFLASDQATSITGTDMNVNAGVVMY